MPLFAGFTTCKSLYFILFPTSCPLDSWFSLLPSKLNASLLSPASLHPFSSCFDFFLVIFIPLLFSSLSLLSPLPPPFLFVSFPLFPFLFFLPFCLLPIFLYFFFTPLPSSPSFILSFPPFFLPPSPFIPLFLFPPHFPPLPPSFSLSSFLLSSLSLSLFPLSLDPFYLTSLPLSYPANVVVCTSSRTYFVRNLLYCNEWEKSASAWSGMCAHVMWVAVFCCILLYIATYAIHFHCWCCYVTVDNINFSSA